MSNKTDISEGYASGASSPGSNSKLYFRDKKNTLAPVMKGHEGSEDLKRYLTHYEDVVRHLERTHLQQTNKLNDDLSSTLCQVRDNSPFDSKLPLKSWTLQFCANFRLYWVFFRLLQLFFEIWVAVKT